MPKDWGVITTLAYGVLLELGLNQFPIPMNKVKCKRAVIISFQNYMARTGVALDAITCNGFLNDAYVVKNLRPNTVFIFYNADIFDPRQLHSIFHEIGHVYINHQNQGDDEEIEANYFASQVIAPNVIIKEIVLRGYKLNQSLLTNAFGISKEAADKKLLFITKYGFRHQNELDSSVLTHYRTYLDTKFPCVSYRYDDNEEERERERSTWLY